MSTQDLLIEIRVLCCAAMNPQEEMTDQDAISKIAEVVDKVFKSPVAAGQTIVATPDGMTRISEPKTLRLIPLLWDKWIEKLAQQVCPATGETYSIDFLDSTRRSAFAGISCDELLADEVFFHDCVQAIEDHRNARVFAQLEEVK